MCQTSTNRPSESVVVANAQRNLRARSRGAEDLVTAWMVTVFGRSAGSMAVGPV
jgi:hypothetical protein